MGQSSSKRRPTPAPALAAPYAHIYGAGFGQGYIPHPGGPVLPTGYMPATAFMPGYGQMQMPMPMVMPQPYVWPVASTAQQDRSGKKKASRKRREAGARRAATVGHASSQAPNGVGPPPVQPRPPTVPTGTGSIAAAGRSSTRPAIRRSQTPFHPPQPLDPEDGESSDEELGYGPNAARSSHIPASHSQSQSQPSSDRRPAPRINTDRDPMRDAEPARRTPSTARESAPPHPLPSLPTNIFDLPEYRETIQKLSNMPDLIGDLKAYVRTQPSEGDAKKSKKGFFHIFSSKKTVKQPEKPRSLMIPVHPGKYMPMANRTGAPTSGPSGSSPNRQHPQPSMPVPTPPSPLPGPPSAPILFNQDTEHAGLLNHSPFRVRHMGVDYPTALHLLEALKFLPGRPDIAEEIRLCDDLGDVYPLAANHAEEMRPNWSSEFLDAMEEVVFLKVSQHANLRSLLTSTGNAHLIYDDPTDRYWGCGLTGDGDNVLGIILERVRLRLLEQTTMPQS